MAIGLINIGQIANDGTGDDLREAFIKVNANFEELDLRVPESTTASNLGVVGEGIFASKVGYDLQFKKIAAGENTTLSVNGNTITINSTGGLQNLNIISDSGSTILEDGDTLRIQGGANANTSLDAPTNTLLINSVTEVSSDNSPQLGGTLDANNFNILNVNNFTATNNIAAGSAQADIFIGPLEGLVYDIDIRELDEPYSSLDFGDFTGNITNWIDYITATYEVDMGSFADPSEASLDFGSV